MCGSRGGGLFVIGYDGVGGGREGGRSLSVGGVVFWQAEDGIRELVRSRGLGDVYKRQGNQHEDNTDRFDRWRIEKSKAGVVAGKAAEPHGTCLL